MTELNLAVEPMVYQRTTDEIFDIHIKNAITPLIACSDVQCQNLTYEEENAVRYVGGYVLTQNKCYDNIKPILKDLTHDDGEGPAQNWLKEMD